MKKLINGFIVIFIFGLILISNGCDELELIQFDTNYYTMDFVLEPISQTGLIVFQEKVFKSDIDEQLSDNGLDRDNFKSAKLNDASVQITSDGEYQDFNFVDVMRISIKSNNNETEDIAWLDPVPKDQNLIKLDLTETDLKKFLLDNQFTITAKGFINTEITEEIGLNAKVRFQIKGSL